MNGSRRKYKGTISLVFLLLLTTGTVFLTALGRVLWQQLVNQQNRLEARQWAQLFTSCCSIRNSIPMEEKRGSWLVAEVKMQDNEPVLRFRSSSAPEKRGLGWQEILCLETADGYSPMTAVRYSLTMPGSREGNYPEGAIWCPDTGVTLADVALDAYESLATGPLPDGNRLAKPVSGWVYYTKAGKKTGPLKYAGARRLTGRGVFVSQVPIILDCGFQLHGDVRIFCAQNVEIRDNVVLDKVFIYSGGTINIGKNSQVKGILAAKNRVELKNRDSVTEDRSVLESFQTLYL